MGMHPNKTMADGDDYHFLAQSVGMYLDDLDIPADTNRAVGNASGHFAHSPFCCQ